MAKPTAHVEILASRGHRQPPAPDATTSVFIARRRDRARPPEIETGRRRQPRQKIRSRFEIRTVPQIGTQRPNRSNNRHERQHAADDDNSIKTTRCEPATPRSKLANTKYNAVEPSTTSSPPPAPRSSRNQLSLPITGPASVAGKTNRRLTKTTHNTAKPTNETRNLKCVDFSQARSASVIRNPERFQIHALALPSPVRTPTAYSRPDQIANERKKSRNSLVELETPHDTTQ